MHMWGGNPLSYVDPSGEFGIAAVGVTVAAVGGGLAILRLNNFNANHKLQETTNKLGHISNKLCQETRDSSACACEEKLRQDEYNGIAGVSAAGADLGGTFGDPINVMKKK